MSVKGEKAQVDFGEGVLRDVNVTLVDAKVGEYVLVHAGYAIQKMDEEEAKEVVFTEKSFGTSLTSQIHLDDIALTGKADRIDLLNKKENSVKFIDYKTGKPKSRNEIEGNTQNSNGDYKRQLVFYKLLSELDKSFSYTVTETEIDFIEPDAKGDFHHEKFSISPPEVSDLKKLITYSVKSIHSLDFSRTTDMKVCDTCPFYSHCWPNT